MVWGGGGEQTGGTGPAGPEEALQRRRSKPELGPGGPGCRGSSQGGGGASGAEPPAGGKHRTRSGGRVPELAGAGHQGGEECRKQGREDSEGESRSWGRRGRVRRATQGNPRGAAQRPAAGEGRSR